MTNVKSNNRIVPLLLAAATALWLSQPTGEAWGSSVTFAQFQQNAAGSPFVFTNAGAASTFAATSVPVNFQYLVPNTYGAVNLNIPATLTLTSVVDTPAVSLPPIVGQSLKNVSISIVANTPVNGDSLLLKVDVDGSNQSTASLAGILGGQVGLQAADTDPAVAHKFAYSSDFISFVPNTTNNYALSFSSIFPALSVNINGYLNRFTGSGTGTFAGSPVPEPGTAVLAVVGAGALVGAVRRRVRLRR